MTDRVPKVRESACVLVGPTKMTVYLSYFPPHYVQRWQGDWYNLTYTPSQTSGPALLLQ